MLGEGSAGKYEIAIFAAMPKNNWRFGKQSLTAGINRKLRIA